MLLSCGEYKSASACQTGQLVNFLFFKRFKHHTVNHGQLEPLSHSHGVSGGHKKNELCFAVKSVPKERERKRSNIYFQHVGALWFCSVVVKSSASGTL